MMSRSGAATPSLYRSNHGSHLPQTFPARLCGCLCMVATLWFAANRIAAADDKPAEVRPATSDASHSESPHYVELELENRVKVSSLKPGDVLAGRLSRDIYSGDRELFAAGTPVHLTVGKLERRKREANDHWPGVVQLFTPRHENYPTFQSAAVSLPEGREVPLRVSLVSIIRKSELHPTSKTFHRATDPNATKQKPPALGQTVILEATGLTPEMISSLAPAQPASSATVQTSPVKVDTGTRAQVVLLRSLSASKNRPGDSFLARLVEPVRVGSKILLPEGVLLQGTVLKATPPRWLSRPGMMTLAFTGLAMPEGGGGHISATIAGAEVDSRSHTRLDSEGGLSGGRPGKAWMLINLGVTAGIAKETDDGLQLVIEALVSTATDASTAGVARIVAACTSGIFMVTRHGRDVVLPRFTEMDITFNRPFSLPQPTMSPNAQPRIQN